MPRRVFGRHEYERRRAFGWPIYSPRWVAGKPKPGLSGHLPQHAWTETLSVRVPRKPKTRRRDREASWEVTFPKLPWMDR